ncbi:MAG TPA: DUF3109 family protein [Chitinophagaceae bacterium]|nr:DUF3109 family protein [Chitinophagaceae bacterium]
MPSCTRKISATAFCYLTLSKTVIAVDQILVSEEVIEKKFLCDLSSCKGGCCEQGDAGAPLEDAELDIIVEVYEKVKPYLSPASVARIESKGKYVYHREFGWVTPTLPGDKQLCVYGRRDERGVIRCAFEEAYNEGVIGWKKPVSCHLFPLVASKGGPGGYVRLNYEPREKLCKPACALGKKLSLPVYVFLREALERKFGAGFYQTLEEIAQARESVKQEIATRKK